MRTTNRLDLIQAPDGARRVAFRYDLLNGDNAVIGDVTDLVESCTVEYNSLADIQRSARMRIRDTSDIDFAIDRIKPWMQITTAKDEVAGELTPAQEITEKQKVGATFNAVTGTVEYPITPEEGNLLVLAVGGALDAAALTAPSGWNTALSASGAPDLALFYKVAGAAESRNATIGDDGTQGNLLSSFAFSTNPYGIAWDGASLWVSSSTGQTISKVNPSTGAIISSFASPGSEPSRTTYDLAWDGVNLWVVIVETSATTIYKLDSAGTVLGSFPAPSTTASGIAWDGTSLRVSDWDTGVIYIVNPSTGAVLSSGVAADSAYTAWTGLDWRDGYLWAVDYFFDLVVQLDPADYSEVTSFAGPSTGARGIAWDGTNFRHTDLDVDLVYTLKGTGSSGKGHVTAFEFHSETEWPADPLGNAVSGNTTASPTTTTAAGFTGPSAGLSVALWATETGEFTGRSYTNSFTERDYGSTGATVSDASMTVATRMSDQATSESQLSWTGATDARGGVAVFEAAGVLATEFPLGVFLLPTPGINTDAQGTAMRDIEAYDQMLVLRQDLIESRYTVTLGTNYVTAITTILSNTDGVGSWNIAPTTKTLPTDKEWGPGTSKIRMVNDLLGAINYEALFFDEEGTAIGRAYTSPSSRASEYTYTDNETSIMYDEVSRKIDLYSVPNKWVLVVSDADRPALSSSYTNTDPSSPTSTVARGRVITDFREEEDAADQATLDLKAFALAVEASQVYEHVEFTTALNPLHTHSDVYTINFDKLGIAAKFSETEWSMDLMAGAQMTHNARRVVLLEA